MKSSLNSCFDDFTKCKSLELSVVLFSDILCYLGSDLPGICLLELCCLQIYDDYLVRLFDLVKGFRLCDFL